MKTSSPSNTDPITGIPHGSTRLGECGDCGGHVVVSNSGYGGGVPPPPTCIGCGKEMDTKKGLPMKAKPPKAKKKASSKKAVNALAAWRAKNQDGQAYRGR